MPGLVGARVDVDLDETHARVVLVGGDPIGVDEGLGVGVAVEG